MLDLKSHSHIMIHQSKEWAELFGFETRNKYEVIGSNDQLIGFVAEQGKSFFNVLGRLFLGHWRSFELHIFDHRRKEVGRAIHPFRWFFQRLEIYDQNGKRLGTLQQRFSFFNKKFDMLDSHNVIVLRVSSPFWRLWTFIFKDVLGQEKARIEKKWSGLLKEVFTDSDNFKLLFNSINLDNETRNILLAATVFIDLQYFEKKAND